VLYCDEEGGGNVSTDSSENWTFIGIMSVAVFACGRTYRRRNATKSERILQVYRALGTGVGTELSEGQKIIDVHPVIAERAVIY